MVTVRRQKGMTAEEFDAWVLLPENREYLFEYIGGEAVQLVSSPYASSIGATVVTYLHLHLRDKSIEGHVTSAKGGYVVGGDRYLPTAAYLPSSKQAVLSKKDGYNPIPPDLAAQVLSPWHTARDVAFKVANSMAAGILVWLIYAEEEEVHVFTSGRPAQVLDRTGMLDGGEVLPGFKLAVKDIFPAEREEQV
jgi:Uma2 family endonuclease